MTIKPAHLVGPYQLDVSLSSRTRSLSPSPPAPSLLVVAAEVLELVGIDDGSMSTSSDTELPPSAPFGRGLRDVPLAPTHRRDDASPPLYGTSPSPAAPLLDLCNLAPVKSSWPHQLRVRARVWAFVVLSDGLGVGGRVLAVS